MKCPKCHIENPRTRKTCLECGTVLFSRGERKHVTVLFSDLVGYTSLTERIDPEDVKEILEQIYDKASEIVTR